MIPCEIAREALYKLVWEKPGTLEDQLNDIVVGMITAGNS